MQGWRVVAALLGLVGIAGATLYAHARPVPALGQAAFMALFHAPVLLWLSDRKSQDLTGTLLRIFFAAGTLVFTGSIYLRYLGGIEGATVIAPAGGTLLILGWLGLLLRSLWSWE